MIQFHNVCFAYPGTQKEVLSDLSFTVRVGLNTAIVGRNGAGKSTIIKLLCGLYQPTSGFITINGKNLADINEATKKDLIGAVFQKCILFPFTVGENIACDIKYDSDKVWKALAEVGLKEKIEMLSKGLETEINSTDFENVGFSGGEKQKFLIARAIYKNSDCILLDEPTSALDAISENKLYEQFGIMTKNKIGIFISHRMSSCIFCDQIIVLDAGEIIGLGTHENLLISNAMYKQLWNAQAKHYIM